jgi:hypothetical protein
MLLRPLTLFAPAYGSGPAQPHRAPLPEGNRRG